MKSYEIPLTLPVFGKGADIQPDDEPKKGIDWSYYLKLGLSYSVYPILISSASILFAVFKNKIISYVEDTSSGIGQFLDEIFPSTQRMQLEKRINEIKDEMQYKRDTQDASLEQLMQQQNQLFS